MISAHASGARLVTRLERRARAIAAHHEHRIAQAARRIDASWRSAAALWPDFEQD